MIRRLFEWWKWGEMPSLFRSADPMRKRWAPGGGLPDDLNETTYITLMLSEESGSWDLATNCENTAQLLRGLADTLSNLLSGNFEEAEE